ncbi:MAG: alkaline phosphatase D family protein [Polyangiaceae bacterium]|jgi:alkaline phosphatase D|nr:alkaline phosphatase D family protein [Polyangiaceae bacterium]
MSQLPFRRRDFLRSLAATAVVAPIAGCGDDDDDGGAPPNAAPINEALFPQSVASGDPRPDSVLLWTRVEPTDAALDQDLEYVVATDAALTNVVARGVTTATADLDHTVKLRVTGLSPATFYYYQFRVVSLNGGSRVGRTKTAPAADADVPVRFAFASCQDFIGRYYHSWQALLDETSVAGNDLDLIVHLGDYIYETTGNPMFQSPDPNRAITLPVGQTLGEGAGQFKTAVELADYRALYKAYRGDQILQRVHERFPFLVIWDDHEFADDSAGDRVADLDNSVGPGNEERNPQRRLNATRAWVEYQPIELAIPAAGAGPLDFQMYRNVRFGKHVELFMTDERLYRDGPVIPEGPADPSVGKIGTNTSLGSHYFLLKSGFDPKEAAVKPTMLGATQKQWLFDSVKSSTATWKVWGNEVQLWQMAIDLSTFPSVPEQFRNLFYFSVDQWDGFRTERAEVLNTLTGTSNFVAITGDVHGFFAAELHPDFDAVNVQAAEPVAAEFVVAGISSQSVQSIINDFVTNDPILSSLGLQSLVPQLDSLLQQTNPHLRFANSNAYGVAIVDVSAASFAVTFLQLGDITSPTYAGEIKRSTLRCNAGSAKIIADP